MAPDSVAPPSVSRVHASELAPSLYVADAHYVVPLITAPNYLATILDICREEKIDVVLSLLDPDQFVLWMVMPLETGSAEGVREFQFQQFPAIAKKARQGSSLPCDARIAQKAYYLLPGSTPGAGSLLHTGREERDGEEALP